MPRATGPSGDPEGSPSSRSQAGSDSLVAVRGSSRARKLSARILESEASGHIGGLELGANFFTGFAADRAHSKPALLRVDDSLDEEASDSDSAGQDDGPSLSARDGASGAVGVGAGAGAASTRMTTRSRTKSSRDGDGSENEEADLVPLHPFHGESVRQARGSMAPHEDEDDEQEDEDEEEQAQDDEEESSHEEMHDEGGSSSAHGGVSSFERGRPRRKSSATSALSMEREVSGGSSGGHSRKGEHGFPCHKCKGLVGYNAKVCKKCKTTVQRPEAAYKLQQRMKEQRRVEHAHRKASSRRAGNNRAASHADLSEEEGTGAGHSQSGKAAVKSRVRSGEVGGVEDERPLGGRVNRKKGKGGGGSGQGVDDGSAEGPAARSGPGSARRGAALDLGDVQVDEMDLEAVSLHADPLTTQVVKSGDKLQIKQRDKDGLTVVSYKGTATTQEAGPPIFAPLSPLDSVKVQVIEAHVNALQAETFQRRYRPLLIKLMESATNGGVFNAPVNAEELGIPDYHNIIKHPMDLGTVRQKLEAGLYKRPDDLANDVILTFYNAQLYNPAGHFVHDAAKRLQEEFVLEYNRLLVKGQMDGKRRDAHSCAFCQGQSCLLCTDKCLRFDPPVMSCDCCMERIKRGDTYHRAPSGQRWCARCVGNGGANAEPGAILPPLALMKGATQPMLEALARALGVNDASQVSWAAGTIAAASALASRLGANAAVQAAALLAPVVPNSTAALAEVHTHPLPHPPARITRAKNASSSGAGPSPPSSPQRVPSQQQLSRVQSPVSTPAPTAYSSMAMPGSLVNLAGRKDAQAILPGPAGAATAITALQPAPASAGPNAGQLLAAMKAAGVDTSALSLAMGKALEASRSNDSTAQKTALHTLAGILRGRLEKRRNDDVVAEPWVQCDQCKGWVHQVCALFNARKNACLPFNAEYVCPICRKEHLLLQHAAEEAAKSHSYSTRHRDTKAAAAALASASPRGTISALNTAIQGSKAAHQTAAGFTATSVATGGASVASGTASLLQPSSSPTNMGRQLDTRYGKLTVSMLASTTIASGVVGKRGQGAGGAGMGSGAGATASGPDAGLHAAIAAAQRSSEVAAATAAALAAADVNSAEALGVSDADVGFGIAVTGASGLAAAGHSQSSSSVSASGGPHSLGGTEVYPHPAHTSSSSAAGAGTAATASSTEEVSTTSAVLSAAADPACAASALPHTPLSRELEAKVRERLRAECGPDVASSIVVRVVSSLKKQIAVPREVREVFKLNPADPTSYISTISSTEALSSTAVESVVRDGTGGSLGGLKAAQRTYSDIITDQYAAEYPYRQRVILLWQRLDGVDVCLFTLYVQEYGPDCPPPNTRKVYIAYLDSVRYLRPLTARTTCYHELLAAYLANARHRGYLASYIWACFPEADHEVLTNRGFMTLPELETAWGDAPLDGPPADPTLFVASYCPLTLSMVYERPLRLIVNPAQHEQPMVEFTQAEGEAVRWRDGNLLGESAGDNSVSNYASLLVTPNHDMYVRECSDLTPPRGGTGEKQATELPPFTKRKAEELLAPDAPDAVAFLCQAAAGVGPSVPAPVLPDLPVLHDLGLTTPAEFLAFLEAYGYWVGGGGSLAFQPGGEDDAILFECHTPHDAAWLQARFETLGLPWQCSQEAAGVDEEGEQMEESGVLVKHIVSITEPRWVHVFFQEYRHTYELGRRRLGLGSKHSTQASQAAAAFSAACAAASSAFSSSSSTEGGKGSVATPCSTRWRGMKAADASPSASSGSGAGGSAGGTGADVQPASSLAHIFPVIHGADMEAEDDSPSPSCSKWLAYWALRLDKVWCRALLAGLRQAGGEEGSDKQPAIWTASVRVRDQLMQLALHAGCSPYFLADRARKGAGSAGHTLWKVCYPDDPAHAEPALRKSTDMRRVTYSGRTWCLAMPSTFLVARRATRLAGFVSRASRPLIVGNCPPQRGDGYIFHCHPPSQRVPSKDRLREWYDDMLRPLSEEGLVEGINSLFDEYFEVVQLPPGQLLPAACTMVREASSAAQTAALTGAPHAATTGGSSSSSGMMSGAMQMDVGHSGGLEHTTAFRVGFAPVSGSGQETALLPAFAFSSSTTLPQTVPAIPASAAAVLEATHTALAASRAGMRRRYRPASMAYRIKGKARPPPSPTMHEVVALRQDSGLPPYFAGDFWATEMERTVRELHKKISTRAMRGSTGGTQGSDSGGEEGSVGSGVATKDTKAKAKAAPAAGVSGSSTSVMDPASILASEHSRTSVGTLTRAAAASAGTGGSGAGTSASGGGVLSFLSSVVFGVPSSTASPVASASAPAAAADGKRRPPVSGPGSKRGVGSMDEDPDGPHEDDKGRTKKAKPAAEFIVIDSDDGLPMRHEASNSTGAGGGNRHGNRSASASFASSTAPLPLGSKASSAAEAISEFLAVNPAVVLGNVVRVGDLSLPTYPVTNIGVRLREMQREIFVVHLTPMKKSRVAAARAAAQAASAAMNGGSSGSSAVGAPSPTKEEEVEEVSTDVDMGSVQGEKGADDSSAGAPGAANGPRLRFAGTPEGVKQSRIHKPVHLLSSADEGDGSSTALLTRTGSGHFRKGSSSSSTAGGVGLIGVAGSGTGSTVGGGPASAVTMPTDSMDGTSVITESSVYADAVNATAASDAAEDERITCDFFDTRSGFLRMCQGNNYQFDTLRRAKHSSMMILWHLHNPSIPAYAHTCNVCETDIGAGVRWHCEACFDFDVCVECKDTCGHPHELVPKQNNSIAVIINGNTVASGGQVISAHTSQEANALVREKGAAAHAAATGGGTPQQEGGVVTGLRTKSKAEVSGRK